MSKIIQFDVEARRKLKEGMNGLARSVVVTLGPKGRTVIFEKLNGDPQVCNDGVTVAKQVELDDPTEDLGAKMLRQAAVKTSESAVRQLAMNAGLEPSEILPKIKNGKGDYGFNFKTEEYENLLKAGVIDPTKVGRLALENAASVAMMMLTTECVISKVKEKEKDAIQGIPQI